MLCEPPRALRLCVSPSGCLYNAGKEPEPVKISAVLIAALALALPLSADFCDLNLRYENGEVRWDEIVGATNYTVLELYGDGGNSRYYSTLKKSVPVNHRASGPITIRYIVTAEVAPGVRAMPGQVATHAEPVDACTGSIDVRLTADPAFRKLTRRAVLPVVGSTSGAFGGKFKTSLTLRGNPSQHGRLIFHPAGAVASDSDPSIPYSFAQSRVIRFDDVVAAMGQQGIGSIDVVPDDDSAERIPEMEARLYNDTAMGTFGTFTRPVLPSEYLAPASFSVVVPDNRFRVNIGVRTLTPTTVQTVVLNAEGRPNGLKNLTFPAGWMEMKSASDFLGGRALAEGESILLSVSGVAIAFYTITENATNDPTLVLGPTRPSPNDFSKFVD